MPKKKSQNQKKRTGGIKLSLNRKLCLDLIGEEQELLFADGFDDCILGVTHGMEPCVVYDMNAMVEVLVIDGMTNEEAIEYLEYNTWGAYVGKQTPIYVRSI